MITSLACILDWALAFVAIDLIDTDTTVGAWHTQALIDFELTSDPIEARLACTIQRAIHGTAIE